MIAYVEGKVLELGETYLVIQVGAVGLQVFVPSTLRAKARAGETLVLFTYLVVREDLMALYGFETPLEREFFGLLLGVNGIGPRLAISILSVLSVDAIRRAILSEQPEVLSRVPGVGRKNAQKIILSLQGKVTAEGLEGVRPMAEVDQEVLEALTSLGYSVVEAQTAVQSIPKDAPMDLEERLKLALRYFST
ncbi:Holliday junction branch migration protein RuvA [Anaerolinea thermophila]|uniref:Holliday junction branch migration complex subunit RuvA n=1 Tax=Anaerolinea thermophila (strain DSM 14523 / JCM 11388 / NBRC 100420 / UNI-1) TaxID=926569 RepID=E8N4P0_ANATU|nr:Holliday junction branch migration protein RuvA [Anaerolinea thermophila]BAJ63404.1 Holliday junction ATP-dependent DNA helicase RuvA [Anaerolinea thermophila UNI-1]